jgi:hypothetical protein
VRIILLSNIDEKAIAMLEKNYGGFDKIIEQLMEEVRLPKQVKDSSDFQEFSNLMENLAVTVENVGKKSHFTSSIVIRVLLKKNLRLQWGQHMVHIWLDFGQFPDSVTTNRCSVTNFVELTTNQVC